MSNLSILHNIAKAHDKIVAIATAEALRFYKQRFVEQNFVDNTTQSWKPTKGRKALSKTGTLKRSIRIINIANSSTNTTITPEDVKKQFKQAMDKNNNLLYEDFQKRKIILPKDIFDNHTNGKYTTPTENRHLYFDKIKEVLTQPSEVYLKYFGKGKEISPSIRYIKAYEDGTQIIIQGGWNKEGVFEIGSWYKNEKENNNRVGFLIKKSEK